MDKIESAISRVASATKTISDRDCLSPSGWGHLNTFSGTSSTSGQEILLGRTMHEATCSLMTPLHYMENI